MRSGLRGMASLLRRAVVYLGLDCSARFHIWVCGPGAAMASVAVLDSSYHQRMKGWGYAELALPFIGNNTRENWSCP